MLHQRQHEILCALCAEVDRDALLAGVDHVEIAGDAGRHLAPQPAGIAFGRLDLHDFRTEVAEHPSRERSGEHAREIEHLQAFERIAELFRRHGANSPRAVGAPHQKTRARPISLHPETRARRPISTACNVLALLPQRKWRVTGDSHIVRGIFKIKCDAFSHSLLFSGMIRIEFGVIRECGSRSGRADLS